MPTSSLRPEHRAVLRELFSAPVRSKAELAAATGWARNTIAQRLDELVEAGWVREEPAERGGLGRPSARFSLRVDQRLVHVAHFGRDQLDASLVTLHGDVIASRRVPVDLSQGPEAAARTADETLADLRTSVSAAAEDIALCVIGMASPVDQRRRAINPVSEPGWFALDIVDTFGEALGLPVLAENDANLMAMGTAARGGRDDPAEAVIFVKVAQGIGAGTVIDGRLRRGMRGLAGELGHVPVPRAAGIPCTCGNEGCLGTIAALGPIVEGLREAGVEIPEHERFWELAAAADPAVVSAIRQAGRDIGQALVGVATAIAPERIVLGGRLATVGQHLTAGVREALFARVLPDMTVGLTVNSCPDHDLAAARGAAMLAQDWVLAGD
ncbi:ROK family protein [Brachybacterium sp. NPDC056505]|uniref:ROK family transcriptional regulator n=1 Tax=Brachybacterium sp. NPDC056505 TaxID=3345843 RepID=UPI00366A9E48